MSFCLKSTQHSQLFQNIISNKHDNQCVHIIMSPSMTDLPHRKPASAQRLVHFPLQFNLPYSTEQPQTTAKSLADADCICDRILTTRDFIKWTPACSNVSLYSSSLQGPITFALTHSSSTWETIITSATWLAENFLQNIWQFSNDKEKCEVFLSFKQPTINCHFWYITRG